MTPSKPHPILAAFLDFYFVSLTLMSLLVVLQALVGRVFLNVTALIVVFVLLLVVDIVYHARLNRKTTFLSYGERVVGKRLVKGKKAWTNPYHKNRFLLFLIIVISFLMIGNTWNGVIFLVLKPAFIMGSIFKLTLVFLGGYLIGKRKIHGVFVVMIPFLLAAFFLFAAYRVSGTSAYLTMLIAFLAIVIGLLVSFFVYKKPQH